MRTGHWFATYTGKQFWLTDPHPDDVAIEDIAHALGMVCRFGGHSKSFYSVAQHSVHVAELLAELFPADFALQLHGLLHDATEAYLGDVVRPLKICMPDYRAYERRMAEVIYRGLGLSFPTAFEHNAIKAADDCMLMGERRDLIAHRNIPWMVNAIPPDWHITPWSSFEAEQTFLQAYQTLSAKLCTE